MSDFIFSAKNIEPKEITKKIQTIYNKEIPEIKEFHGTWGSLGISRNLYNGFNAYENDNYITIVIGGPLLMFRDNSFLNDKNSFEGTKAIFERWKKGEIKWDEDLSGPFVILMINKLNSEINIITDIMSFIPVFSLKNDNNLVFSTHVDAMAKFTEQTNVLDYISITDFVLHGVITYPNTMYKNIFQVSPASQHTNIIDKYDFKSMHYWLPSEKNMYKSINLASINLRKSLKKYVDKITSQTTNIAQFISGGEDSRMLSGLLKKYSRDAFVFLDEMNREGKIANKVANIYGANFKPFIREKLHYLNILPESSNLVGSSFQYQHAHTYGFHNKSKLNSYDAVFGGLYSDALFKGTRIKKIKGSGKLPFIPEIKKKKDFNEEFFNNTIFEESIINEIIKRRKSHLEYIKKIRSSSAEEWFELWPSSMNSSIPNIHVNRRLFCSYEPFLSNEVVKISAAVPQKWKLNRKLFHKMAKPLLKPSKWLRHGDGWFPYYSWIVKTVTFPVFYYSRKAAKKLGFIKGNQGPWSEWNVLINSEKWAHSFDSYKPSAIKIKHILKTDVNVAIYSKELSIEQRVNLLQVLYRNMD